MVSCAQGEPSSSTGPRRGPGTLKKGWRHEVLTLPNALTALRIALAPIFLVLYVEGETQRALTVFAVAAATDLLDGLVARALDQHTRLGAFLDPIADKILAACALFALAARGRLPFWLPVFEVSRDIAQLAGAFYLRSTHHPIPVAPTRIGKYATFLLVATVVLSLAGEFGAYTPEEAAPFVAAVGLLAAECVAMSFAQYSLYFIRSVRALPIG